MHTRINTYGWCMPLQHTHMLMKIYTRAHLPTYLSTNL